MKRSLAFLLATGMLLCSMVTGCTREFGLNPKNPVTLTLWHNYGGIMRTAMDELLDTFNSTLGKNKGIIINVTSVNSSAVLQEKLLMAAHGDPGAPQLPDITTCYPKTAIALAKKGLLADLNQYFGDDELSGYVTSFITEGQIDGKLYIFPIAKSTEVVFVNQTLFDRFFEATGITLDSLSTFEGMAQAAISYCQWTDDQTPNVPNDGKAFFAVDSFFNLMQAGMEQLGSSFIQNQELKTSGDTYNHVYETLFEAAVKGGCAIYDGYSSDLSKTGDIVCSTGSTAGILFYGDTITYPDNTAETVEYAVLPYPVFEKGKPVAIQRGGGMAVTCSEKKREYAAAVFLKWFTSPEQNMKFVSETGYLPVTNDAFGTFMQSQAESVDNINIRKLLKTAISMHKEYDFYVPPVFDTFDSLGQGWESQFKEEARAARKRYLELLESTGSAEAYRLATAR